LTSLSERHITSNATEELKLDGFPAEAIKTGGKVCLRSRNNTDFNRKYPVILKALAPMPDNASAGVYLRGTDVLPGSDRATGPMSAVGTARVPNVRARNYTYVSNQGDPARTAEPRDLGLTAPALLCSLKIDVATKRLEL
jgi:hypothetical protein